MQNRQDERLCARPNSAINIELLFQVYERALKKEWVANHMKKAPSYVTRLLSCQRLETSDELPMSEAFEFQRYGLSPSILSWPPARFHRELLRVGYGKYRSLNQVKDWLETLPVLEAGRFVPEELLTLLTRTDSHRGLGSPGDGDIPSADGIIGQRYGLALEIEAGDVASAVQRGTAYALLVHCERHSEMLTVVVCDDSWLIRPLSWLFMPLTEADPEDEDFDKKMLGRGAPIVALLAERQRDQVALRVGFEIIGNPGLRDIYLFLFANRPVLGDAWFGAKTGQVLKENMVKPLMDAISAAERQQGVKVGHIVYEAKR